METIGPSAFVLGILYYLSRWSLATVEYAVRHPGKGRPEITWHLAWFLALIVSGLSAASVHIRLLTDAAPGWGVSVFNIIVFGGFFVGFLLSGLLDHRVRLRG